MRLLARTLRRYQGLLLVAGGWLSLALLLQGGARLLGISPGEALVQLAALCASGAYCLLIFVAAALLCPLLLIPAALLGVLAGHLFGPLWGLPATLLACNLSAALAFGLGRACVRDAACGQAGQGWAARYSGWLRRNAFFGIVLLRLAFMPYDAVSYLAGALRIGWGRFLLANTIGCLPGALALTLIGASLRRLDLSLPLVDSLDRSTLAAGIALMLVSLALAWGLRRIDLRPRGEGRVARGELPGAEL